MAKGKNGKDLPKGIRMYGDRYEGRVTYNGVTVSVTAATITETKKRMREAIGKLERGYCTEKMKFSKWFDTWLNEFRGKRIKIGTKMTYQKYYDSVIGPYFGNMYIDKIRGDHVQKFYNELDEKGYALSSIKVISAVLSGCLKQAEKLGYIDRNPVPLAELPREKERDPRTAMTKREQDLFMTYAKDSYLYNLFVVMLHTGMRNGEVRGMKYSDIDFQAKVIHVQRTLKYIEGGIGFIEDTPKTRSSKRDIPLEDKTLIEAIEDQRNYWSFKVESIDRYLFCNEMGKPLSRERVQSEINRIIRKIRADGEDFPHITPHVFRHTFTTRAIEAGTPPEVVAAILGHKAITMTMNYNHVQWDVKASAMGKLASCF